MPYGPTTAAVIRFSNAVAQNASYATRPVYVGLYKTDVRSLNASTMAHAVTYEITTAGTNGYTRALFVPSDPGDTRETHNVLPLSFGPFAGSYGTLYGAFLCSEQTGSGGDLLWNFKQTYPFEVLQSSTVYIDVGALSIYVGYDAKENHP